MFVHGSSARKMDFSPPEKQEVRRPLFNSPTSQGTATKTPKETTNSKANPNGQTAPQRARGEQFHKSLNPLFQWMNGSLEVTDKNRTSIAAKTNGYPLQLTKAIWGLHVPLQAVGLVSKDFANWARAWYGACWSIVYSCYRPFAANRDRLTDESAANPISSGIKALYNGLEHFRLFGGTLVTAVYGGGAFGMLGGLLSGSEDTYESSGKTYDTGMLSQNMVFSAMDLSMVIRRHFYKPGQLAEVDRDPRSMKSQVELVNGFMLPLHIGASFLGYGERLGMEFGEGLGRTYKTIQKIGYGLWATRFGSLKKAESEGGDLARFRASLPEGERKVDKALHDTQLYSAWGFCTALPALSYVSAIGEMFGIEGLAKGAFKLEGTLEKLSPMLAAWATRTTWFHSHLEKKGLLNQEVEEPVSTPETEVASAETRTSSEEVTRLRREAAAVDTLRQQVSDREVEIAILRRQLTSASSSADNSNPGELRSRLIDAAQSGDIDWNSLLVLAKSNPEAISYSDIFRSAELSTLESLASEGGLPFIEIARNEKLISSKAKANNTYDNLLCTAYNALTEDCKDIRSEDDALFGHLMDTLNTDDLSSEDLDNIFALAEKYCIPLSFISEIEDKVDDYEGLYAAEQYAVERISSGKRPFVHTPSATSSGSTQQQRSHRELQSPVQSKDQTTRAITRQTLSERIDNSNKVEAARQDELPKILSAVRKNADDSAVSDPELFYTLVSAARTNHEGANWEDVQRYIEKRISPSIGPSEIRSLRKIIPSPKYETLLGSSVEIDLVPQAISEVRKALSGNAGLDKSLLGSSWENVYLAAKFNVNGITWDSLKLAIDSGIVPWRTIHHNADLFTSDEEFAEALINARDLQSEATNALIARKEDRLRSLLNGEVDSPTYDDYRLLVVSSAIGHEDFSMERIFEAANSRNLRIPVDIILDDDLMDFMGEEPAAELESLVGAYSGGF